MPDPAAANACDPARLARHDWCWVDSAKILTDPFLSILSVDLHPPVSNAAELAARAMLQRWIAAGRPLVVTRQSLDSAAESCRLALCGPPGGLPRRIALEIPAEAIATVRRPPLLRDTILTAPADWQASLRAIDQAYAEIGLPARVFGSLAWQTLTGLSYMHDHSDLDLVIELSAEEWKAAITSTGQVSGNFLRLNSALDAAPFPCDCELRVERDAAFSLTELRGNSRQVLAKRNTRSDLVARSCLWGIAA